MPEDQPAGSANRELAAQIVAAYLRRNQIAADQIAALISSVYKALNSLGKPAAEAKAPRTPAVPIRHLLGAIMSFASNADGKDRHVTTAHGLTVSEYRERWNLQADHPMTATGYSERRSIMAKQLGLGRGRPSGETATVPETAAEAPARPKRRSRRRSAAPPA